MQKNRIRGPVMTLATVVALGGGLWLLNVSQETDAASPPTPVVNTAVVPALPPPGQPGPNLPATAKYTGTIPTNGAPIALDLAIDGTGATAYACAYAYACDGYSLEVWLKGSARNGALALASKDGTSRLAGRLRGTAIVGTLWIGERKWQFTAPVVPAVSAW